MIPSLSVCQSICLSLLLSVCECSSSIKGASGSVLALLSRSDSYYCIVFLFLFFSFCYIFLFLWFVFVYALKCVPWTHARLGERKSRWERADNIDNVWREIEREREKSGERFLSCHANASGELTRQSIGWTDGQRQGRTCIRCVSVQREAETLSLSRSWQEANDSEQQTDKSCLLWATTVNLVWGTFTELVQFVTKA